MKITIIALLWTGALFGQAPQIADTITLQQTRVATNSALTSLYNNSARPAATMTINGVTITLGASNTLNSGQITESGNLYFTSPRVLAAMAGLYEVPLTFSAPITRSTNTISLNVWGSGTRPVAANALGVSGNCMSWSAAGAADAGAPCGSGGGGSSVWSALTNPSTSLSLTMAANQTTFTYNSATGAIDGLKMVDGAGNTGSGILAHFTTASGSTMIPWQADANGVGWRVGTDGSFQPVGQTAAGQLTLQRGTGGAFLAMQGSSAGDWRINPPASFSSWNWTFPTAPCAASQWWTTDSGGIGSCAQPSGSDLSLSDVTTNNATTGRHGFLPKLSGNSGDVLNGLGAFVPGSLSPLDLSSLSLVDDFFLNADNTTGQLKWLGGDIGSSGCTSTGSYQGASGTHPGILRSLTAGTGTGLGCYLVLSNGSAPAGFDYATNTNWTAQWIVQPSTITSVRYVAGLISYGGYTANPSALGAWMRYDTATADPHWMFEVFNTTSLGTSDSGVSAATNLWFILKIRSVVAGTWRFSISTDSGATYSAEKTACASTCDINGTLPNSLAPGTQVVTLTAGSATLYHDRFAFLMTGITR